MKKTNIILFFLFFYTFSLHAFTKEKHSGIEPVFSVENNFFNKKITVRLLAPTKGEKIYFTTDGSTPRPIRSQLYKGAITIHRTTVLKAIGISRSKTSKVVTHTYFIREPESDFLTVSLSLSPDKLFDPERGLFVSGKKADETNWAKPGANFWSKREIPVNTEIFDTTGQCVFNSQTGFRLFGGVSRLFPQKSMVIVTRKRYGKKKIKYPIFGEKGVKEFKFLVLRNSGSDFGKSQFRDAFMTTLGGEIGLDKQDFRPAHVYINGKYWGIYNIREKINTAYLKSHHQVEKDSIDLIEHRMTLKKGSLKEYVKMLDFIENHDLSITTNLEHLNDLMDIDNFLNYEIAQIYFDNEDAGGNIKFWRSQRPGSRWRWILYDTDWGFGMHHAKAYRNNSLEFHTKPDGPNWPNPPWSTFILRNLLKNKDFEKKFVNRFADLLNSSFKGKKVARQIDTLYRTYLPEMPRQFKRWHLSSKTWERQVAIMKDFALKRPRYVRKHLSKKFKAGKLRKIYIDASTGGKIVINDFLPVQKYFSGIYFQHIPITVKAVPQRGYRLSHWEGIEMDEATTELTLLLPEKPLHLKAVFEKYEHPMKNLVMINEIAANNKLSGDWVELYNYSNETVNLNGWEFRDNKHIFTFPEVSIPPKDYLVLCQDKHKFQRQFHDAYNVVSGLSFGINKRKEVLMLNSAKGAFIDSFSYDLPPVDSTFTLNLLLPSLDNSEIENWEIIEGTGSPNFANAYYVQSTLQKKRELWMQIGGAIALFLIGLSLLILKTRGKL